MDQEAADRYAPGQVWEYRHRPQDDGSLLKIQRAERGAGELGMIYHVSVIGVNLGDRAPREIPHAPVSRATLDASVTRLSDAQRPWPTFIPGIAAWRADEGGVFTVPIAEVVDFAATAYRIIR